jgi:hypothetical protein
MAKHRLTPTDGMVKRARARIAALFTALSLVGLFLAVLAGSANAAVTTHSPTKVAGITRSAPTPYHQAEYRHVSGNTYEVNLQGWAPDSEVTLFKQKGADPAFYQVPNWLRSFSGETDFDIGVNAGTTLEIDVWNGQQTTYAFYFTAGSGAAPASTHWNVL